MSDIVDDWPCAQCPEHQQALREIERLTARLKAQGDLVKHYDAESEQRCADNERLRTALEAYACPGLGQCREPKLDDGSCLVEATGGRCGDEAHRALEQKP